MTSRVTARARVAQARQAETALGDDVAEDLDRPAADRETRGVHDGTRHAPPSGTSAPAATTA